MITVQRVILIILLSVLGTLSAFSQYFNRIIQDPSLTNSFFWQVFSSGADIYGSLEKVCDTNSLCCYITHSSPDGKTITDVGNTELLGFYNRVYMRNDTIFYSSNSFSQDSFTVWHFGMMDRYGHKLAEYQYKILHINDTAIGPFGYQTPTNYGLTLVNKNEVILWGEGLDNRHPSDAFKVPYKSVFLRIDLDGRQKGNVFWFDMNDNSNRRMSDAVTDIDGNMVFVYEYMDDEIKKAKRSLFKVMPNDSISLVAELIMSHSRRNLPKVAIDGRGDFYINPNFLEGNVPGYNVSTNDVGWISKIDRSGKEVWRRFIPPFNFDFKNDKKAERTFNISRIATTRNNDILISSDVFIKDSFYLVATKDSIHDTGYGSTIARYDTDGNLIWRHYIVPKKKDGTMRNNYLLDIKEMEDGSIIVGGRIERDDDDIDPRYNSDAWLMRLTPDGCLTADCKHIGKYFDFPEDIVSVTDDVSHGHLMIYPNPGDDQIHIQLSSDVVLPVQYQISDVQGRIRESGSQSLHDISLDSGYLTTGLYIITIRDSQGKISMAKWVKE